MPKVSKGMYVDSTAGDIINPKDHREYLKAVQERDALLKQRDQILLSAAEIERENLDLRRRSLAQLILDVEEAMRYHSHELDLQQQWRSYNRIRGTMVSRYFFSHGVAVPPSFSITHDHYLDFLDTLMLDAFIEQSYNQDFSAEDSISAIKNNRITVRGEGGRYCTGLLLTRNGYFLTANHCSPIESIVHQGNPYRATGLSYNEGRDIIVGKAVMGNQPLQPLSIKFASPSEIETGTPIVVYGTANGNDFLQMGTITNPRYNTFVRDDKGVAKVVYDAFQTNARSRQGFSGGPIYIEETGELVGISLFNEKKSENLGEKLGGARVDYLLELLKFEREWQIIRLKEKFAL